MKNEDKKVPDAPKRLWVRTNSLIHDTGLTAVGNVSYREYWIGHKNKVPDIKPYCYEEEEDISASADLGIKQRKFRKICTPISLVFPKTSLIRFLLT